MVCKLKLFHSLIEALSKVMYLVHAGCPAVLSQSYRIRQLAAKTYANGATERAASFAGATQPICVARGALPSTQLQVSLRAFNQCPILRMSLVLLTAWPAYVNRLQCLCLYATAFGRAVCAYASACKQSARISGQGPDSTAPTGPALPGCDAQWDCPAIDQ